MSPISAVSSSSLMERSKDVLSSDNIFRIVNRIFEFIADIFSNIKNKFISLFNKKVVPELAIDKFFANNSGTYQCQETFIRENRQSTQFNYTLSHDNGDIVCKLDDPASQLAIKINSNSIKIVCDMNSTSINDPQQAIKLICFQMVALAKVSKPFIKSSHSSIDLWMSDNPVLDAVAPFKIKKTIEQRTINGENLDVIKLSCFARANDQEKLAFDVFCSLESCKTLELRFEELERGMICNLDQESFQE